MTTANIFSVGKNSNAYGAVGSAGKDPKQVAEEAAEIFGAVMNQMSQDLASMQSESNDVEETTTVSMDTDVAKSTYEYSPRDNRIERAVESDSKVQDQAVEQEVEELAEDVVETISEKLNISKEVVLNTMEELGISETDLLMPEKLGQLVMELTGETDVFNLLTNSDFQAILQEITGMEKEAAASLGMNLNQFKEAMQEMNQSADEMQMPQPTDESVMTEDLDPMGSQNMVKEEDQRLQNLATENQATENQGLQDPMGSEKTEQPVVVENVPQENEKLHHELTNGEINNLEVKEVAPEEMTVSTEQDVKDQNGSDQENLSEELLSEKMDNSQKSNRREEGHLEGRNSQFHEGTTVNNQAGEVTGNVMAEESFSEISYSNIDVDDLMQQFVEKTQITVLENKTTMDMQLNPENLGKIYLHISTEEGSVHAQIMTTNEVVKEALEAQLATLRENLNQAGVKVDSVDVSVATHEFEQNLEQNSKKEEEQARMQEEVSRTRRNLNLNSLDELAGVLSEEEVLVAQMMRDNGNSVDFTA